MQFFNKVNRLSVRYIYIDGKITLHSASKVPRL